MASNKKLLFGFKWEQRVYRLLGVHHFKKIVPLGDYWVYLIRLVVPGFRVISDKQSALIWVIFTICVELLHVIAFFIIFAIGLVDIVNGRFLSAAFTAVLNLFVNVYPIMVQRFNRARLVGAFKIRSEELTKLKVDA